MLYIIVIAVTAGLSMWYKAAVREIKQLEKEHKYVEMAQRTAGMTLLAGINWGWLVALIFLSLSHSWWLMVAAIVTSTVLLYKFAQEELVEPETTVYLQVPTSMEVRHDYHKQSEHPDAGQ